MQHTFTIARQAAFKIDILGIWFDFEENNICFSFIKKFF